MSAYFMLVPGDTENENIKAAFDAARGEVVKYEALKNLHLPKGTTEDQKTEIVQSRRAIARTDLIPLTDRKGNFSLTRLIAGRNFRRLDVFTQRKAVAALIAMAPEYVVSAARNNHDATFGDGNFNNKWGLSGPG